MFRIGCAIWAYKAWVGGLYPSGSRSADFLRLYGQRFTTVEGNTTFYSTPDEQTVQRWVMDTPAGFHFCPKLPRDVSHQGLLAPQLPAAIAFLDRMAGLGDRLGPMFLQLPPSYGPAQQDDLRAFLAGWPHDRAELAVEVRHLDWFREVNTIELTYLLAGYHTSRVLLDTRPIYDCPDDPQIRSERKKPRVPLHKTLTTDTALIRYISHPSLDFNEPYFQDWARQITEWLQADKRVYLFIHCPVEEHSPRNARQFQYWLEQAGAPVPPLPWDAIAQPPEEPQQLSLF
ncbi:DUF72 domain-containing protein [Thermoleptolyngbya sichuanensis A183]|uniref:DUF72 domain-containing protein n=1 Tax=Thermoleptolyngbya sichuanensis A183 TaxID=2737172 RepID=A0A6M8B4Y2_9CYAN|nr:MULTISPECIES: DUF72 domain-containing protein [Thermoleptolyngbya]QKD81082.1 DUF72 domain-containing protein [Thermoleptolyngbya sichuanensis A183]